MPITMEEYAANEKVRKRAYQDDLRDRAWAAIGTQCCFCGEHADHMAHIAPTSLVGAGRGSLYRYRDVIKHPKKYRPMCTVHHRVFDKLMAARVAMLGDQPVKEEAIPF